MALPVRAHRGHQQEQQNLIAPIDLLHSEFDNVLGRFFGANLFGDGGRLAALGVGSYGVDIREDEDHIYVDVDLPGFKKDEIEISIDNNTLTISAEHREGEPRQQAQPSRPGARGEQSTQEPQSTQQPQEQQPGQQPSQQPAQSAQAAQSAPSQGDYLVRERRYTRFLRSFTLPPTIDPNQVSAQLQDGVLHITIGKRQEAKPRRIPVS